MSIYRSLSNQDWPSFFVVYIVDFKSTTNPPGTRVSPRPNAGRKKQNKHEKLFSDQLVVYVEDV